MQNIQIIIYAILLNIMPLFSADISSVIQPGKGIIVDISDMYPFYESLSPDEKPEQLRDWSLWGLLLKLDAVSDAQLSDNDTPMRYNYTGTDNKNIISPGRIKYLDSKNCIIITDAGDISNKYLLGAVVDNKYMKENWIPEKTHIFGYTLDTAGKAINIKYVQTVPSKNFFSQEYGYTESEIKNFTDLTDFLLKIDDITLVKWKEKSVIFGGRKHDNTGAASLAPEDIAVLYQAYNVLSTPEKEEQNKRDYNIFINSRYNEALKNNPKLRRALAGGQITRGKIMEEIRKRIPYQPLDNRDVNVGFSLDPQRDFSGLYDGLIKLTGNDPQYVNPADSELVNYIDVNRGNIVNIANKLKSEHDLEPLLVLRRKYANTGNSVEKRFDEILHSIDRDNSYQTARYDGKLQGTTPGMILFYTDLIAKLWALDYNDSAPRDKITGFNTMPYLKVPKLYWDDFMKLSNTRLWFGLLNEGFEVYDKKILFKSVATRVYAASSDPLYPGKESKPNYQSGKFLGWWDAHYEQVADYEPQYHKLNQIQKWSCILAILKEEKNRALDFLFYVQVPGNLDFETWYKSTGYLKCKPELAFLDRNKYNKTVECLPMVFSKQYPLMGRYYYLYGGVSLASKSDILSKLKKKTTQVSSGGKKSVTPVLPGKPADKKPAAIQPVLQMQIVKKDKQVELSYRKNNVNYGKLSAEKPQINTVKLKWNKGTGVILNELLNKLVQLQETQQPGYKDDTIFNQIPAIESVQKVADWKSYIIKHRDIRDKWVYLSINDSGKSGEYIARNSGTNIDSDIFCAKLITEQQKQRILPILNNPK